MKTGPSIKVYKIGEEILNTVAEKVTKEEFGTAKLSEIVAELNSIGREMGAVGFSAPQIGYSKRIIIIGMEFNNSRRPNVNQFPNMTFINPELTETSEEMAEDWEGCASIDKTLAYVSRPISVGYKAQDEQGNIIQGKLKNFPARVFQHEIDHLNGELMDKKAIEIKEFDKERDVIISMKP